MDRRQVDHGEAELGELRQDTLDAGEAAEGAWKQLVPGAETCYFAVDIDLEQVGANEIVLVGHRRSEPRLDVEAWNAEQQLALGELARKVLLTAFDLAPELVAPGGEAVAPGLDGELPASEFGQLERAGEEVVAERGERDRAEPAPAGSAVEDAGAQNVVAVAEDRRADLDRVSDGALDGMAAAVDRRLHVLDANSRRERFHRSSRQMLRGSPPGSHT